MKKSLSLRSSVAMALLASLGIGALPSADLAKMNEAQARSGSTEKTALGSLIDAVKNAKTRAIERALFSVNGGRPHRRTFPGYGWTVAHDRRQAKKRRNRARNRLAHR